MTARKRQSRVTTRDPKPTTRDPVRQERKPRRFIPASMPVQCPACGCSNTRMADGRHTDPVRQTILEYRTCGHCGERLAAGREMTGWEKRHLCHHAEAVAEYEETIRQQENRTK
jgi:hypothetical protein